MVLNKYLIKYFFNRPLGVLNKYNLFLIKIMFLNNFDKKFMRLCKDLLHKTNYHDLDDIMK